MQTRPEDEEMLIPWLKPWYHFVSGVFMNNYMNTVREAPFVPKEIEQSEILLKVFSLQKAFYELEYELNNRPDWVAIPMEGINMVVQSGFEN
jgi:maltose alpha-D-glucosyltransferase/alpha-amylase